MCDRVPGQDTADLESSGAAVSDEHRISERGDPLDGVQRAVPGGVVMAGDPDGGLREPHQPDEPGLQEPGTCCY